MVGSTLRTAVSFGKVEEVKRLLRENGAARNTTIVNEQDDYGRTPLHTASNNGYLAIVQCLVEQGGTNVDVQENDGSTLLHQASLKGHLMIVEYLVQRAGANVNARDNVGRTPLHEAVFRKHLSVARYLVANEANVHAPSHSGNTPLHEAVIHYKGRLDMIHFLVQEAGANVGAKNRKGDTAVHFARVRGYSDVVRYLVPLLILE